MLTDHFVNHLTQKICKKSLMILTIKVIMVFGEWIEQLKLNMLLINSKRKMYP